jgi:hypothetical protein
MTFIPTAPVAPLASPAPAEPDRVIINDGWFPDIDPADIRADRRIRDVVTPRRMRTAVIGAIMTVRVNLRDWAALHREVGAASLAQVPADTIDGESVLVLAYERAIGAYARAELVEGYRDTDLTGRGDRKVEDLEPSVGELRRDALHAIRDMLAVGRTNVDLI